MCMNHCPTTILGAIKVSKYLSNMWFSHSLTFPIFFAFDWISTFTPGLFINLSILLLSSFSDHLVMPHSSSSVTDFYSKLNPPSNSPKFAQISADFPRNIATKNLATRNFATRNLATRNLATWNLARLSPPRQVLPLSLLLPPLGSPVLEPHLHIEYKADLYKPYISNISIYFLYYHIILLNYHYYYHTNLYFWNNFNHTFTLTDISWTWTSYD